MNAFDWTIIAVVGMSMLFAFFRGVTRELIALLAWVLGFIAAVALTPLLGGMLPEIGNNPVFRYLIAFVAVFIACLVIVDRFLGAVFGAARGIVLVIAFVLVAGLTTLPRLDWWQNAALAPPLAVAAMSLKPWLPPEWAQRLDYSREGRAPAAAPANRKV